MLIDTRSASLNVWALHVDQAGVLHMTIPPHNALAATVEEPEVLVQPVVNEDAWDPQGLARYTLLVSIAEGFVIRNSALRAFAQAYGQHIALLTNCQAPVVAAPGFLKRRMQATYDILYILKNASSTAVYVIADEHDERDPREIYHRQFYGAD